jgi:hypothetical protein
MKKYAELTLTDLIEESSNAIRVPTYADNAQREIDQRARIEQIQIRVLLRIGLEVVEQLSAHGQRDANQDEQQSNHHTVVKCHHPTPEQCPSFHGVPDKIRMPQAQFPTQSANSVHGRNPEQYHEK